MCSTSIRTETSTREIPRRPMAASPTSESFRTTGSLRLGSTGVLCIRSSHLVSDNDTPSLDLTAFHRRGWSRARSALAFYVGLLQRRREVGVTGSGAHHG